MFNLKKNKKKTDSKKSEIQEEKDDCPMCHIPDDIVQQLKEKNK